MFYKQLIRARKNFRNSQDIKGELTRLWFSIFIGVFATMASLSLAIFDLYNHRTIIFCVDIVTTFCYIIALVLFYFGQTRLPKYIIFFSGYIGIIINSSFLGINSGLTYLWFPYVCGVFILFDIKKIKKIITLLALILLAIAFLEYTEYQLFHDTSLSKINTKYYTFLCYLISIAILSIYIYTLHYANERYKNRITIINKSLRNSNSNLRKVNHELDSFVYKTSHDLRAPLTSLLGLIEIAKIEKNVDTIKQYLVLCEKSVFKLDSFIIDILNISKNERQEIQSNEIDFEILISEILLQLEYLDNSNRIETKIIINDSDTFFSDKRRINIVLNNLITNAIIYADLSKEKSFLDIRIVINKGNCVLTFLDNGIGIKPLDIEKVYQMFYRASAAGNGSGLGLYIVKETVAKLNGSIAITSEYGHWTSIKITLPNLK